MLITNKILRLLLIYHLVVIDYFVLLVVVLLSSLTSCQLIAWAALGRIMT